MDKFFTYHLPERFEMVAGQSQGFVLRSFPSAGYVASVSMEGDCAELSNEALVSQGLTQKIPLISGIIEADLSEQYVWIKGVRPGRAWISVWLQSPDASGPQRQCSIEIHVKSLQQLFDEHIESSPLTEDDVKEVLNKIDPGFSPRKLQGMKAALFMLDKDATLNRYMGEEYQLTPEKVKHFMGIFVEDPDEQLIARAQIALEEFIASRIS